MAEEIHKRNIKEERLLQIVAVSFLFFENFYADILNFNIKFIDDRIEEWV